MPHGDPAHEDNSRAHAYVVASGVGPANVPLPRTAIHIEHERLPLRVGSLEPPPVEAPVQLVGSDAPHAVAKPCGASVTVQRRPA